MTSVRLSRTMCVNSLRRTATNESHTAPPPWSGSLWQRQAAGGGRGFGRGVRLLLRERDEHVLERRPDLADLRVVEASRVHLGEERVVAELRVDQRVDALAEDRRAVAERLALEPRQRSRRTRGFHFDTAAPGGSDGRHRLAR